MLSDRRSARLDPSYTFAARDAAKADADVTQMHFPNPLPVNIDLFSLCSTSACDSCQCSACLTSRDRDLDAIALLPAFASIITARPAPLFVRKTKMAPGNQLDRANTVNTAAGDLELGYTDAIQRHYSRHVVQRKPVSQAKLDFEKRRPRWLRECMAEATGTYKHENQTLYMATGDAPKYWPLH